MINKNISQMSIEEILSHYGVSKKYEIADLAGVERTYLSKVDKNKFKEFCLVALIKVSGLDIDSVARLIYINQLESQINSAKTSLHNAPLKGYWDKQIAEVKEALKKVED